MNEQKDKKENWRSINTFDLQKFLLKVILKNLVWMGPIAYLLFKQGFGYGLAFICLCISFSYWEYERFKLPPQLKLYISSQTVSISYKIAIWGFMALTAYTVGMGINNNYITDFKTEWFFPIGYSVAFTALLFSLTYMIKSGKYLVLLTCVYLLFDIPGALPFNYLFFYENQKLQHNLDVDKVNVKELSDETIKYVAEFKNDINKQLIAARNNKSSYEKNHATNNQTRRSDNKRQLGINTSKFDTKISNLMGDSLMYSKIDNINQTWKENFATGSISREEQLRKIELIKKELNELIKTIPSNVSDTNYSKLTKKLLELKINDKTQIEAIQELYSYIGEVLKLSPPNPDLSIQDKRFIRMCLLPSIIIDLLPLLFSIVYAKWDSKKSNIEK